MRFSCSFNEWSTAGYSDRAASMQQHFSLCRAHFWTSQHGQILLKNMYISEFIATSKLESKYSQIKPAVGFNNQSEEHRKPH